MNLTAYNPAVHAEGLHHDDSPCVLAVEDRGMAAIVQSANRENAHETAKRVLALTHPPIILGPLTISTQNN